MNHAREITATVVGAAIGGLAGYLFFTERGRSVRRQMERGLEDLPGEFTEFRNAITEAAGLASEGWTLLTDALGPRGKLPTGD
jgi:gas vesicle protein